MDVFKGGHPDSDALATYVSGRVSDEEAHILEAHLAECEACRVVLECLPDDPLSLALRGAKPAAPARTDDLPREYAHHALGRIGEPRPALPVPDDLLRHPRYRVLEMVGRGGMGVVYKAEHRLMARLVALKVIHAALVEDPEAVERFRREVMAAARLHHPNIVTAYDADQVGSTHFLVMEFISGTSLADLIVRQGPQPVPVACAAMVQVALGLQYAYELGMAHRDIKPQNLMRTDTGDIKILDFGLANFATETLPAGQRTEAGAVMGTPDYIAPEQARDPGTADIRADLYSLGCTFYHLLSGIVPFSGRSAYQKVVAHLEQTPRSLTELRGDVPEDLARIVARLMAKDREQRFQTPAEVIEALSPFLTEKSPPAAPATPITAPPTNEPSSTLCLEFETVKTVNIPVRAGTQTVSIRRAGAVVHQETVDLAPGSTKVIRVLGQPGSNPDLPGAPDTTAPGGAPAGRVNIPRRVLTGHNDGVLCAAFSPFGFLLASAGHDRLVMLWDVVKGERLVALMGHGGPIRALGFSPDGRTLASAGDDRTIILWHVAKRQQRHTLTGHRGAIHALTFHPDGRTLFSGGDDGIRCWDMASGTERSPIAEHGSRILSVACGRDGLFLAAGGDDQRISLWDLSAKKLRRTLQMASRVSALVLHTDGRTLAAAGDVVHFWDVMTGDVTRTLRHHRGAVACLALHPANGSLAIGSADHLVSLSNADGMVTATLKGHTGAVAGLTFSPDGRLLASGGMDKTVSLWKMNAAEEAT